MSEFTADTKLIDLINLTTYDAKIKEYIKNRLLEVNTHTHSNKDVLDKLTDELFNKLANLKIDDELLLNSSNPVENKVVKQALDSLREYIDAQIAALGSGGGEGTQLVPRFFSISGGVTADPVLFDASKDVVLEAKKVHATALYLNDDETLILNGDWF